MSGEMPDGIEERRKYRHVTVIISHVHGSGHGDVTLCVINGNRSNSFTHIMTLREDCCYAEHRNVAGSCTRTLPFDDILSVFPETLLVHVRALYLLMIFCQCFPKRYKSITHQTSCPLTWWLTTCCVAIPPIVRYLMMTTPQLRLLCNQIMKIIRHIVSLNTVC